MNKWSVLLVILGISSAFAAPLFGGNANAGSDPSNGGVSGKVRGPGGEVSAEAKLKQFKGTLYLFAPQPWIETFNAIPEAGQACMLTAFSDPANAAIAHSDDVEQAKQLVQSKCPENAAQINAFFDATQATMKSLPAEFLTNLKSFGQQAKQMGESFKQQAAAGAAAGAASGAQAVNGAVGGVGANADQFKQKIAQFSKITAAFLQQVTSLSQEDRQQIATAFPKLTPFVVGANSNTFLKELTELYSTLSSGQFDPTALRTEGEQLKTALTAVWNEYKTANADGLQQASQLFGKDLSNAFQSGQFFQGGMSANVGVNGGADASSNWNEKKNELRDRLQGAWQNAKTNGAAGLEKAKEAGQNAFDHFKDHGVQGNGSVEEDGASVDVATH